MWRFKVQRATEVPGSQGFSCIQTLRGKLNRSSLAAIVPFFSLNFCYLSVSDVFTYICQFLVTWKGEWTRS